MLIRVCHKFKVERLFYESSFNDLVVQQGSADGSPFLYDLRTIHIRIGIHRMPNDMSIMVSRSRVRELVFRFVQGYSNRLNSHIVSSLKELERIRALDENYSVLSFAVWLSNGQTAPLDSEQDQPHFRYIRSIIERNKDCQQAVVALLILRKRICKQIDHNLMETVILMVWETRETKAWSK